MTYPTPTGVGADILGAGYGSGLITGNYGTSREAWEEMVFQSLLSRYSSGEGGSGWATGDFNSPYGRPDPNDFGSGTYGPQTVQFIKQFVRNEGATSNWVQENFGPPPEQSTTWMPDPNSPSSLQGTWEQRSAFDAEQSALDRQHDREMQAADNAAMLAAAGISADAQRYSADRSAEASMFAAREATARTSMEIAASWREAQLRDATQRYIAEGDWGVQKWVTQENNTAAMERLQLQLGFERERLAQDAIAEKNRHHENMVGLALEVAKYDAELAGSPRNWAAYAAWLQNRNIVVNGMTLAMAAQEVPEQTINPAEVAAQDPIAGQQALVSGQSGGSQMQVTPEQLQEILTVNTGAPQGTTAQQMAGGALPQHQPSMGVEDLEGVTDYGELANQLMGVNPLAPTNQDYSQQNLQAMVNSLSTGSGQQTAQFGAYGGPTVNAMGVDIGREVEGSQVDYRKFTDLLPSQQQAKVGGVESVRGPWGAGDWIKEMNASRPKGGGAGTAAFG